LYFSQVSFCVHPAIIITVILAVLITAFVTGMIGNLSKGKVATMTLNRVSGSSVSVLFAGGQDAGSVVGINWTVNGATPATTIGGTGVSPGIQDRPASGGIPKVGATAVLAATRPGRDHVAAALCSLTARNW
jgi:archaeal type IV pilus assembly protein PilA